MTTNIWPQGLITALVTPLHDDAVDLKSLAQLVEYQIDSGVGGLVVTGGTGEHGALSVDERALLIREVVKFVAGRVPVIAATGCFTTAQTIELSRVAKQAGVAGLLLASPFGEPISWAERYAFYQAVTSTVELPVMIYNTPPAGVLNLDQIKQLAELPNISAVKDSSGDPELMGDVVAWAKNIGFGVYVGKDSFLCEALVSGAQGVVFGVSNFIPRELVDFISRIRTEGATPANLQVWSGLRPFLRFMEGSSNYVAFCKIGCKARGIDVGNVRAPYLMPETDEKSRFSELLNTLK
ncbi:dihydrodipicolinate synthase family protein [Pseudomonas sp. NPDC087342]|uniref:dihydrodipicolinate synthase family protein n=1 Tax=Pseudomonas sp. NPDC087342 TaxID=3364437 RepID=UPI0038187C73